MLSTEKKNGEKCLRYSKLIFVLPTSQELIYCIMIVGIFIIIAKSDIVDGVSLDLP